MPSPKTKERLRSLILSATDLRSLSGWPEALIEDYLNTLDNLITISNLLDIQIDQKIEEVPTDFIAGSILFKGSEFLVEDNANLFWDSVVKALTIKNLSVTNTSVSRLIATDGSKLVVSVADLTAWIKGTANQILITDNLDGTATISIPDTNVTGVELESLTDDSMADALHRHSELSASDGTPDAGVQVDAAGKVGIGTAAPTEKLDINSDAVRIRSAQTPASAVASGTAGMICWDPNYLYVCVATNTWKRTSLGTW